MIKMLLRVEDVRLITQVAVLLFFFVYSLFLVRLWFNAGVKSFSVKMRSNDITTRDSCREIYLDDLEERSSQDKIWVRD